MGQPQEGFVSKNDVPSEVKKAFDVSKKYFPTPIQEFQLYDKYARFNYEKGRRETWTETVDRSVNYLKELSQNKLDRKEYERIRTYMLEMKATPSMRLIAMAGEAAHRDNTTIYNCSYSAVDSINSFVEMLFIAMAGTGVGYSVEKKYTDKLPIVKKQIGLNGSTPLHIIEDSTEGWAKAFRLGLESWFEGRDYRFDYSLIRPAGSPLKIKGGRSSGPEPLKRLLEFTKEKILSRQEQKLRPLDVHDIVCKLGEAIVSGGVRRTALISLFDSDDLEMLNCKNGNNLTGNEQRWMANNSTVWEYKITQDKLLKQMYQMFDGERGEPGIFSRHNAIKNASKIRNGTELKNAGTNPCFSPETLVHTKQGHYPIKDLVDKNVEIWDGEDWVMINNFRVTSVNEPILKITLHDGSEIRATDYHTFLTQSGKKIEAKDLRIGEKLCISNAPLTHGNINTSGAYIKGFLIGDGTHAEDKPMLWLYEPKYCCETKLIESANEIKIEEKNTNAIENVSFVADLDNRKKMRGLSVRKQELFPWSYEYKKQLPQEIFAWNLKSKLDFIAGVLDSDGTASDTTNGFMYQLSSINKKFLLDFQTLLKTIGVHSKISLNKRAGFMDFNDGYGEYETQDCYRLTISQVGSVILSSQIKFERLVSFHEKKLSYYLKPKFNKIISIERDGVEEKVYCCTVPTNHSFCLSVGIRASQCGEIILRNKEFCNLSIAIARPDDTLKSLKDKIEVATIIGTIQSMATYFPYLSDEWRKNCEEERLLGVDINGWLDAEILHPDNPNLPQILQELKEHAIEINKIYAKKLGINQSASVTCVKPSGNSSILFNCSPGLHARWSKYYIRNARVQAHSPLAKMLKDQGVPMDPENGQTWENANTYVVHFPVKAPETTKSRHELNAIQQLEYWLKAKMFWTTHNPSVTISYKPNEIIDVIKWLWDKRDYIGGLSFLPASDAKYDQMPYEEITKQQYEQLSSVFPDIDYSQLWKYEKEDFTTSAQELSCVSGACSIDDYRAMQSSQSLPLTA